jgi:hypothetical protein
MAKKTIEDIILEQLKSMDAKIDKMHDKLDENNVDIAELKVKSSVWGGISGGVSGLITGFSLLFMRR